MSKKVYTAIDVAKLIFSLGIVILHSSAYTVLPGVLPVVVEKFFLRLVVPFFFVVSGFFLGGRLQMWPWGTTLFQPNIQTGRRNKPFRIPRKMVIKESNIMQVVAIY